MMKQCNPLWREFPFLLTVALILILSSGQNPLFEFVFAHFVSHAVAHNPELEVLFMTSWIWCLFTAVLHGFGRSSHFRTQLRVPALGQVELWHSSASLSLGEMISCLCAAGLGEAQTPCRAPTCFICWGLNFMPWISDPSSFSQTDTATTRSWPRTLIIGYTHTPELSMF